MPVLFRGQSEYNTHYKWTPSFRSAGFIPKPDQAAHDAGMRSDQLGKSLEPGFTIKKKVWHRDPQVQSCLIWWPSDHSDVQSEASEKPPTPQSELREKPKNTIEGVRKAGKKINGEIRPERSPTKKAVRRSRSLDGSVVLAPRKEPSYSRRPPSRQRNAGSGDVTPKRTPTERGSTKKTRSKANERRAPEPTSPNKNREQDESPVTKSKQTQTPSPKVPRGERKGKTKSPTPTRSPKPERSPKKGSPAKKANVPLERKVGLNANKPSRLSKARMSEYQQNFIRPKFAVKPSPLLSALDVVHSSSPAIPPHGGIKFRPTSEYVANYKKKESPLLSKSVPPSPASPSMKQKVKDMQNPQQPFFSHAKQRNLRSEYATQYEANREFQIGEMRQMAENNKQKHEGTHIDPNHATQVISPFNRLWEASSNGSGSKDDKSSDKGSVKPENESRKPRATRYSPKSSRRSSDTMEPSDIDADSLEEGTASIATDSLARKLAWGEPDEESEPVKDEKEEKKEGLSNASGSVLEGRITTPRLQELGGAQRTHHDLTTPAKGGALLVSPPRPKKAGSSGSYVSSSSTAQRPPASPVAGAPTPDAHRLLEDRAHPLIRSSPAARPVTYSLDKRQRPATAKEPLIKRETPTKKQPVKDAARESPKVVRHSYTAGNPRAPIRGTLRNEEFQHCGPTGRLPTPIYGTRQRDEDALSVASSLTSARASDLLRRAQERKSFWTTT